MTKRLQQIWVDKEFKQFLYRKKAENMSKPLWEIANNLIPQCDKKPEQNINAEHKRKRGNFFGRL